uniref:Chromatin-remodeling ATPase INO80 n=1 Tax=Eptatretus burgeri TaxID=7764 RepID=A0A8C4RAL5_EPTBU
MDRAHRLGQTKQVTVYRIICKGTIEERILQRAKEKSEIQKMVISGSNFKPDALKPKEVVSLLLDDEELEKKRKYWGHTQGFKMAHDASLLDVKHLKWISTNNPHMLASMGRGHSSFGSYPLSAMRNAVPFFVVSLVTLSAPGMTPLPPSSVCVRACVCHSTTSFGSC